MLKIKCLPIEWSEEDDDEKDVSKIAAGRDQKLGQRERVDGDLAGPSRPEVLWNKIFWKKNNNF